VLLEELIDRKVHELVLNTNVSQNSIHWKALFVVHKDNFGGKSILKDVTYNLFA
jgi:hypothetical protein